MYPQHPCLEKYLTLYVTQQRNPQMKFKSGIQRHTLILKFHLGLIDAACLSPL